MGLTHQQQEAVYAPGSVSVTAGAGTGKTHMLSERYVHHITDDHLSPLQIVAVTFTEKAAAELRSRIRGKIYNLFDPYSEISAKFEAAPISTLHSIAARICKDHFEEAGVPPDFQILDEVESTLWKEKQIMEILEGFPMEWFHKIPFSLMKNIINTATTDPFAVTISLEYGPEHYKQQIEEAHQEALQDILDNPEWGDCKRTLQSIQGDKKDKLETSRINALTAIFNLENHQSIYQSLETLKNFKKTHGSAKNWPSGECQLAKDTLEKLRDPIKNSKNPFLFFEYGESDIRLEECYPIIKEAVHQALQEFEVRKKRERILDYNDLEIHAIRALEHQSVQDYYAARWKAFLIDEFQDTNPTQEQILLALCKNAKITIVGDIKQSIYGFRRADIEVFLRFQKIIQNRGGTLVNLDQSFRTHEPLVNTVNQIFAPLLKEHHQDLTSTREAPHHKPYVQFYYVPEELGKRKFQKQQFEAEWITNTIKNLINDQTLIYDPEIQENRPTEPKDIAILSRTWDPLDTYSETLQRLGVPAIVAAGGSLLETREALDAIALLSFLAEPDNSIALAAILRSPFFAISDVTLYEFVEKVWWPEHRKHQSENGAIELPWWPLLSKSKDEKLLDAYSILKQLLNAAEHTPPNRLLHMADQLTGYTAVIGNLLNAERRIADWRGFIQWIIQLEEGNEHVFGLVRKIKVFQENEAEISRLPLESRNSVSLMTIHSAKGLEWPIVFVPDLSRKKVNNYERTLFDPEIGFSVNFPDEDENKPLLYSLIQQKKKKLNEEESIRLFYVAFTRARDALFLSSTDYKNGYIDLLNEGLNHANIVKQEMEFDEQSSFSHIPDKTTSTPELAHLLQTYSTQIDEINASDITAYALCPYRFYLSVVEGHRGITSFGFTEQSKAQAVGTLTHLALEERINNIEHLQKLDRNTNEEWIHEAFMLSQRFWQHEIFKPYHDQKNQHEVPMVHEINGLTIRGVIDCLGTDFVLDYKTGEDTNLAQYRYQVGVYALAKQRPHAAIADLRHCELKIYEKETMKDLIQELESICQNISSGVFDAYPSKTACCHCPFNDDRVCSHRYQ